MAKLSAVWGIDIGQSALKALRCRANDKGPGVIAEAFDYIEYPKILSQPDADAEQLVLEALRQFLSRNDVRGTRVMISVSGQNGLARFIKLPPVETKKIPDIVKYEAKQQIPFPLEEVVWDYQQMSGGVAEEGFALETEVGLFAMKRDQVYKTLKPFHEGVDVEVDTVQLTPLALYNYVVADQLPNLPSPDDYDPESPPDSLVVLSLGTDTTDLVVTNGFRVWQRSIPVGGSHFTKALVKDLKLNFATAEHQKRNASTAPDPKALFQAMRPVFNDLLTEVQRSIGYFKNMEKRANISRVVALGNVMKLPGLQKYLAQNLGFELTKVDSFKGLSGPGVIDQPAFRDNLLAFGVCYGLCLQGLKQAKIQTNLLPPEIIKFREIRAKKPWFVAAAALLLIGLTVSFFMNFEARRRVVIDDKLKPEQGWPDAFRKSYASATMFSGDAQRWNTEFHEALNRYAKTDEVGQSMLQNVENRDKWLQFLKAVNLCLPQGQSPPKDLDSKENVDAAKAVMAREVIKVDDLECVWVTDLNHWYESTRSFREAAEDKATATPAVDPNNPDASFPQQPTDEFGNPLPVTSTGPYPDGAKAGWVVRIKGHHYHNDTSDVKQNGNLYVINTFIANLNKDEVAVPGGSGKFPVKKLGISHPVMMTKSGIDTNYMLLPEDAVSSQAAPAASGAGGVQPPPMPMGTGTGGPAATTVAMVRVSRLDFEMQFAWQPQQRTPTIGERQPAANVASHP